MPPLWEGDLLYMPVTLPGISVTAASDLLQRQDAELKAIPAVKSVFGKAGRFETATDPSPLSMLEVTIKLKDKSEGRPGLTENWCTPLLPRRQRPRPRENAPTPVPPVPLGWTGPSMSQTEPASQAAVPPYNS